MPVVCTAPVAPLLLMPAASQTSSVAPAASVNVPAPVRAWQFVLRLPPVLTVRPVLTLTAPPRMALPVPVTVTVV